MLEQQVPTYVKTCFQYEVMIFGSFADDFGCPIFSRVTCSLLTFKLGANFDHLPESTTRRWNVPIAPLLKKTEMWSLDVEGAAMFYPNLGCFGADHP